jgi:hypothetical protein
MHTLLANDRPGDTKLRGYATLTRKMPYSASVSLRYWTGSLLAGSVLAAGACMCTAASAEAAPTADHAVTGTAATHPTTKSAVAKHATTTRSNATATDSAASKSAVSVIKSAGRSKAGTAGAGSKAAIAASHSTAMPSATTTGSALASAAVAPSSSVTLALHEIAAAQSTLTQQTWGRQNVLAGAAALAPQVLLSVAQSSLATWQTSNPAALAFAANTVSNPLVHIVADVALMENEMLPGLARISMQSAALLIPVVGLFGASAAASQTSTLVYQAARDGLVYALIPLQMKATTEPVVYISVNGGPRVAVLVDSGSSGLVIDPKYVGAGLGTSTGSGSSGYSGGLSYTYDMYTTTVDFGNGIVSSPTNVDVVSDASASAFADYFQPAGVVGVLGIGPNAGGPDDATPLSALPGELGDGVLLNESFGYLVLGPNPLPARVTLAGAPYTDVQVKVGKGSKTAVQAVIDSGGVTGTMLAWILTSGQTSGDLPAGTKISVYTADGSTLLYSYTTTAFNTPAVTSDDAMNTGYTPFQHGPVYIGLSDPSGDGTISFDYL